MSGGRLIAVVGPSGVGKDSVMAGIAAACPDIVPVRRVITRAPDPGAEVHDAVSAARFEEMAQSGAFCLYWGAHGLHYGIPAQTLADVRGGATRMANLSRNVLPQAAILFPALTVLHVTATPDTLAQRLAGRGREDATDIAARLRRAVTPLPPGLDVIELPNDGPLDETIARALAALHPVRA